MSSNLSVPTQKSKGIWPLFGLSGVGLGGVAFALTFFFPKVPLVQISHPQSSKASKIVTLFFLGDTGRLSEGQKEVALLLEKKCMELNPDAVIFLGDNFYDHGVTSVKDPLWTSAFEQMYNTPCLKELKFYAALGNHDYQGNVQAQMEYANSSESIPGSSGRWQMPQNQYVVNFGELVSLHVIDTEKAQWCGAWLGCEMDQAQESVEQSKAIWKLVAGHHPFLSGGKYKQTKPWHAFILPRVLCPQGHFYFAGHDHNLQYLEKSVPDSCRFRQVISGAGGAPLVNVDSLPGLTHFAKSTHGFVAAHFSLAQAKLDFFETSSSNAGPIYTKIHQVGENGGWGE
jgi:hypothetical protein